MLLQRFDFKQGSQFDKTTLIILFLIASVVTLLFGIKLAALLSGLILLAFFAEELEDHSWFLEFYEDKVVFQGIKAKKSTTLFVQEIHQVSLQPSRMTFHLKTGEEVVLVYHLPDIKHIMDYAESYFSKYPILVTKSMLF